MVAEGRAAGEDPVIISQRCMMTSGFAPLIPGTTSLTVDVGVSNHARASRARYRADPDRLTLTTKFSSVLYCAGPQEQSASFFQEPMITVAQRQTGAPRSNLDVGVGKEHSYVFGHFLSSVLCFLVHSFLSNPLSSSSFLIWRNSRENQVLLAGLVLCKGFAPALQGPV
jgi:hypothetical protein